MSLVIPLTKSLFGNWSRVLAVIIPLRNPGQRPTSKSDRSGLAAHSTHIATIVQRHDVEATMAIKEELPFSILNPEIVLFAHVEIYHI